MGAPSGPAGAGADAGAGDYNGVFEGGGAKGLMYVGALEECERRAITFKAVAGSSAGAITSMLVACGYVAEDLKREINEASKLLGNPLKAAITLNRRSLLSSSDLRAWLAQKLVDALGPVPPGQTDHTFRDVKAHEPTRISLYVVAMDLSTGQPIVFSPDLTPDASVADAVIASSAIPVALPSPRFDIDGQVRRLADGGVYANYPAFVFLDADFRAAHPEIDDGADQRDTIGFVLDDVAPQRVAHATSEIRAALPKPRSSDIGAAPRDFGLLGGFVTSPFGHLTLCLLPVLLAVLGALWFHGELEDGMPTIGLLPDAVEDIAVLMLVVMYLFVLIQLIVVAMVVIRLGRALSDEGLMGTKAALGVGPNVPYWVGVNPDDPSSASRRHVAVRLDVPKSLSTLGGEVKDDVMADVLTRGREQTAAAFDHAFQGIAPIAAERESATDEGSSGRGSLVLWLASGAAFAVGLVVMLALTFEVVRAAEAGHVGVWQLLAILAILALLELLHIRSRSRRAELSNLWLAKRPSHVLFALSGVAAVLGVVGGVVAWDGDDTKVDLSLRERLSVEPVAAEVYRLDSLTLLDEGEFFGAEFAGDDSDFDDELFVDACEDDVGTEFADEFSDEFDDAGFLCDPFLAEEFDALDEFDGLDDELFVDFDRYVEQYLDILDGLGYFDGNDRFYEVDLENFDLASFPADGLRTAFVDLDKQPLLKCFEFEECLVMKSDRDYEDGEEVLIRYHRDRSILFFNEDRWRFSFARAALSVLLLAPLAIGYQLWVLAGWKRDREKAEEAAHRAAGRETA